MFQLSCLDVTGKGTVELKDMENYYSSKACLFLQRVIKTSNDNNRCPKARNYQVISSHTGLITGTEPNYPLGCMLVFFLQMSGSCRCAAEQDVVQSLQHSS